MLVATANVNGIRAAFRRGMGDWLARRDPDVLLLQEVRGDDDVLGGHLPAGDWHLAHEAGAAKGRAGVAIASRLPMSGVRVGLGTGASEDVGRWVEADLELDADRLRLDPDGRAGGGTVTVVSTYLHSATAGTASMDAKYAFLEAVTARLAELAAAGARVVVGGDLNIAHREVDLKNWKGNLASAGFLPAERAYLDRWFDELGWHDLGRRFGGDGPGPYTWWSWRGKAFDNDAGWRIDYQLATPALAASVRTVSVDRAPSYAERWSDHAPLVVEYDLPVTTRRAGR